MGIIVFKANYINAHNSAVKLTVAQIMLDVLAI